MNGYPFRSETERETGLLRQAPFWYAVCVMRVLFIADRLTYDGRSDYALNLARGLKEARIDLQFALTGGELRGQLDALKVENYLIKHNFFSFRKLVRFLREFKPEVVHVTSEQALDPARRIARALRRSYLLTVHDLLDAEATHLQESEVQGVIVANEDLRETLVNRVHVPKEKIRLIARGIDLDAFDIAAPHFEHRMPVIGCMGRFTAGKSHEHFLRAARMVIDAGREALFLVAAHGGEERQLRRAIRDLKLREAVTIATPQAAARKLYAAMDIVVLPAEKATSSKTALEAMASRRPVIAIVAGDLLHLVRAEENALAVEPGDAEGLARAITRLLSEPEFARELGERGRAFVTQKYPLARMIEHTIALYEEVVRGEFPRR